MAFTVTTSQACQQNTKSENILWKDSVHLTRRVPHTWSALWPTVSQHYVVAEPLTPTNQAVLALSASHDPHHSLP